MNFVESLPYTIAFTVLSGIYFPHYAVAGSWGVFVGRVLYAFGYSKSPQSRLVGFLIITLFTWIMMILSVVSIVWLMQA